MLVVGDRCRILVVNTYNSLKRNSKKVKKYYKESSIKKVVEKYSD